MGMKNISLPDSLKAVVNEQVSERGYGTSSEYVRELIRKDWDRLTLSDIWLPSLPRCRLLPGGPWPRK